MNLHSRLSRAVGMLCKIRHYVDYGTLRMIYYGLFSSILMYGSQIWGQHNGIVTKLQVLQNKAIRIINFCPTRTSATPLFKRSRILKLADNVSLQNFLFAHDSLKNNLPTSLAGQLSFVETGKNTRSEMYWQLNRITSNTCRL